MADYYDDGSGGLGGLGGSLNSFLTNPLTLMSLKMMANNSPRIGQPVNTLEGTSDLLLKAGTIQKAQQDDALKKRAMMQALIDAGVDPAQARIYANNPEAGKLAISQMNARQTRGRQQAWEEKANQLNGSLDQTNNQDNQPADSAGPDASLPPNAQPTAGQTAQAVDQTGDNELQDITPDEADKLDQEATANRAAKQALDTTPAPNVAQQAASGGLSDAAKAAFLQAASQKPQYDAGTVTAKALADRARLAEQAVGKDQTQGAQAQQAPTPAPGSAGQRVGDAFDAMGQPQEPLPAAPIQESVQPQGRQEAQDVGINLGYLGFPPSNPPKKVFTDRIPPNEQQQAPTPQPQPQAPTPQGSWLALPEPQQRQAPAAPAPQAPAQRAPVPQPQAQAPQAQAPAQTAPLAPPAPPQTATDKALLAREVNKVQDIGKQITSINRLLASPDATPRGAAALNKRLEYLYKEYATTNLSKDYNRIIQQRAAQGLPFLSMEDYQKQLKAPLVNIDQKQESAYSQKMGTQLAEQNMEIVKDAQKARGKIAALDELNQLLKTPDLYTGPGGKVVNKVAAYAKSFFGIDISNATAAQAAESISSQFALELRNPSGGAGMPGGMSDKDREFLQSMPPGIDKLPGSNELLGDYMKRKEQRSLDVERQRQKYVKEHGKLDEGFFTELSDWADAHPLFTEQDTKSMEKLAEHAPGSGATRQGLAPPASARRGGGATGVPPRITNEQEYNAIPKGQKYTDPDGNVRMKQ